MWCAGGAAHTARMTDTMTPTTALEPGVLHGLFEAYANAGDLDRLMSLYEPDVAAVPEPGRTVHGTEALRAELGALLALKPHFRIVTRQIVQTRDVALLSNQWTASATSPDGQPLAMAGLTAEVARRQPDGNWRFVIDHAYFVI